ncbi:MAG: glycerol-3-phosphate acyltransferase, partial [Elioraea tepidiphila]
ALLSRISSVGALVAAAVTPVWLVVLGEGRMLVLIVLLGILVIVRHASNIRRIRAGTEPKIGQKKAAPQEPAR